MKKYLLAFTLAFAGCLNTQTKSDLARPDFSKPRPLKTRGSCCSSTAPVASPTTAPVQTKTAMVIPEDDGIEEMQKSVNKWFQENPDYDTRSRTF